MAISNRDVRAMRSRIQDALNNPKQRQKRSRKKKVAQMFGEQLSLGDFLVSMLHL